MRETVRNEETDSSPCQFSPIPPSQKCSPFQQFDDRKHLFALSRNNTLKFISFRENASDDVDGLRGLVEFCLLSELLIS